MGSAQRLAVDDILTFLNVFFERKGNQFGPNVTFLGPISHDLNDHAFFQRQSIVLSPIQTKGPWSKRYFSWSN
jgi:hypothetical protein